MAVRPEPLRSGSKVFVCVDVGGTKTAVSVLTAEALTLHREVFASETQRGFVVMFERVCTGIATALERFPTALAIGVSIGGPVDSDRGLVLNPPHLPGWDGIALGRLLRERFSVPAFLEHDAKAGALAEWRYGAGRGARDLVFLTLGTGLGAGVIVGGQLLRGAHGAAGEVGHWRLEPDGPLMYGKHGSWESLSSGAGIAALAHHLHPDHFGPDQTAQAINATARAGDPRARSVLRVAGEHLGRGMALLVDLLAPEVIVLGSLAARLEAVYLQSALETLRLEALPATLEHCQIRHAQLADRLGDVAALCVAHQHGGEL
jgi:glucokinase